SACGQAHTPKIDTIISRTAASLKAEDAIYNNMSNAICNCITTTMVDNKPYTVADSCYKQAIRQYTDGLKAIGRDVTSQKDYSNMINAMSVRLYRLCPAAASLFPQEYDDKNKLLFKGSFVSQRKLPDGTCEVTLQDNTTKEQTVFKSKYPFDEKLVEDYLPGYELTMEYELIWNKTTEKNEYHLKESAPISTIGAKAVKKE
ncbi:MAG TPA: hypothetical protein VLD19_02110, partial [Chitinophagaceae bacterium]|nr:hypothetical protein [Chitinophagaceae bacterium]